MRTRRFSRPARHTLAAAIALMCAAGSAQAYWYYNGDYRVLVTDGGDPDPARTDTCSLRQALNLSSGYQYGNCAPFGTSSNFDNFFTIEMAPWLANSHIRLEHGPLLVRLYGSPFSASTDVWGHGVVIDAQHASRVMTFEGAWGGDTASELTLRDVTLTGGDAGNDPVGGGGLLFVEWDGLTLVNSRVTGNRAIQGGGISAIRSFAYKGDGFPLSLRLIDTTVDGNTATVGGGIFDQDATVHIVRSTISGNHAERRVGGMFTASSSATPHDHWVYTHVVSSTFSGNTVADLGPGFYYSGSAIYNQLKPLVISNTTISGNSSGMGGAIGTDGGSVQIVNSIVSGNSAASWSTYSPDIYNFIGSTNVTAQHSVLGTQGFTAAGGNQITDTPGLGPLADNGGVTQTRRLLAGSPAIDLGDDTACVPVAMWNYRTLPFSDQRQVPPQGAHCDAGAFELRQGSFTIAANASGSGRIDAAPLPTGSGSGGIANCTSAGGAACTATFVDENDPSMLIFTATPATGWHFTGWSGDCRAWPRDDRAWLVVDANQVCNGGFAIDTHAIGGIVQGLTGSGLVLQLNGANDLPIAADGHFAFPTALDYGASYAVSIATQPSAQTCSIQNGSGVASSDVDVAVICAAGQIPVNVSVAIDDGATFVLPGDTPMYAITLRNDGDATAYGVGLATSVAPAGALSGLSWTCGGCSPAGGAGDVALTLDLPAHSQATALLQGTVVGTFAAAALDVTAQVSLPSWYVDSTGTHTATDSNANPTIFRNGFDNTN